MATKNSKRQKSAKTTMNELHNAANKAAKALWEFTGKELERMQAQVKELQALQKRTLAEKEKLEAKVAMLEQRPTVDDFLQELVEETKGTFEIHRQEADPIRQVLRNLKKTAAAKELNVWIKQGTTAMIGQLVMNQQNYGVDSEEVKQITE